MKVEQQAHIHMTAEAQAPHLLEEKAQTEERIQWQIFHTRIIHMQKNRKVSVGYS